MTDPDLTGISPEKLDIAMRLVRDLNLVVKLMPIDDDPAGYGDDLGLMLTELKGILESLKNYESKWELDQRLDFLEAKLRMIEQFHWKIRGVDYVSEIPEEED